MSSRRGLGGLYRPKYRDPATGALKESRVWWMTWSRNGKRHRESTGKTRQADARAVLTARLGDPSAPLRRDLERTTFEDLAELIRVDYKNNAHRSGARLERSIAPLGDTFGLWRMVDITAAAVETYKAARLEAGYSPATVNRELAALRRMLRLGRRHGLVAAVPDIVTLAENNARTGFVGEDELRALLAALPAHHRGWTEAAYITGWRVKSELLTREWRHVDFDGGWLRLEPGEGKTREGRMFPLIPRLRSVLERQREYVADIERKTDTVTPWVFAAPDGEPVKWFYKAWRTARTKAGLPSVIAHDFRRSAVRNLERAGVARSAAMRMVGHRTGSIYQRYAIVDEAMLREGAKKLATHLDATARAADRKVVPMRKVGT